jgi:hypothetical protein
MGGTAGGKRAKNMKQQKAIVIGCLDGVFLPTHHRKH